MSVLLLDVGNSRVKWRLTTLSGERYYGDCDATHVALQTWVEQPQRVMVSSVRVQADLHTQLELIFGQRLQWLKEPLPSWPQFKHCYPEPSRLGVDRWLAMLGGRVQQSGDLLVVDAGTALTIDLFSSDNRHQGGYIVPGLRMAQNALFSGTDRVRAYQDEQDKQEIAPGKNTLNCVAAGVLRQNLALVQSLLDEYPEHQPLITGGDGQLLASRLGLSYSPDLIFDGMDSLCAGSSIV